MSDLGKYKLSDALTPSKEEIVEDQGGHPTPTHEASAEKAQATQESDEARDAEASNRERMVKIGRGNQQAGRQGQ